MTDTTTYDDMNVEELREQLRERKLPVSGTKDELVARLGQDDVERQNRSLPLPPADTTNADDVEASKAQLAEQAEAEAEALRQVGGPDKPAPAAAVGRAVEASQRCQAVDGCQGKAVNGVVCSYHAMWYRPDGGRRP